MTQKLKLFFNESKKSLYITLSGFFAWVFITLTIYSFHNLYNKPFDFSIIKYILVPFLITVIGFLFIQYGILKFIFPKNKLKILTHITFVNFHGFYGTYIAASQDPQYNSFVALFIFIIGPVFFNGSLGLKGTLASSLFYYVLYCTYTILLGKGFNNDEYIITIIFSLTTIVIAFLNESTIRFKKGLSKKRKELHEKALKLDNSLNETKTLINNIKVSIFAIEKDFKVVPPVSKYSDKIFGIDIVGKKVSDFLFSNIKKGTKEYRDLLTVFSIIFSGDEIQYFGVSENLPKKVTLPDENKNRGKTLKLSYSPFFNKDQLLEKLMCTVEDITDSEEYLKKAEEDQVNFNFMNEILDTENKEELSKELEFSLSELFDLLEDFTSPLSDTYLPDYFHDKLKNHFGVLYEKYKHLKELDNRIINHISKIEDFESLLLRRQNNNQQLLNPQVEAASIVCDMIETFLQYIKVFKRFIPINLSLNRSFEKIILEKVKDIDKVFKNLFEYIFLVREVDQISDKQFQKAIQVAKLYPDFDRTMDLIQQRSRLLSFLCLGTGEEEISKSYNDLSYLVRQMPERSKLSEFMIKKNLIEPYKEVVEKTKNIEEELPERIEERKKEILSDFDYLKLLNELLKRFLKEKKEGPDQNLPPLPEVKSHDGVDLAPFINTTEICLNNFEKQREHSSGDHKELSQESLNRQITTTEFMLTRILKKELNEKNAIPVSKTNRKFVSFLKAWTSGKD